MQTHTHKSMNYKQCPLIRAQNLLNMHQQFTVYQLTFTIAIIYNMHYTALK